MGMLRTPRNTFGITIAVLLIGGLNLPAGVANAATPPALPISQVPLTVVQPTHPQVLFAVGNSQSMDGDLSGAIMTGSGALGSTASSLSSSSSPVNYTIPAGFTAPVTQSSPPQSLTLPSGCAMASAPTGQAPYTTSCGSTLYDTSASRLNVAKEGLLAILNQYMATTNFALEDYSTSGNTLYTTWAYYMSKTGGFTFTNTKPTSGEYITNPCWNYTATATSSTVKSNCTSIAGASLYSPSSSVTDQYMVVGASSDDANINDVLYWTGSTSVFVDYGTVSPATPYPPNRTLAQYESGSIDITYGSVAPSSGIAETGPTNAGYVPFSTQVMYAQRGFGYYVSSVTATTGNTVVGMTTAGVSPTPTSTNTAITAFVPSLAPETNAGSGTSELKALAFQSPLAGLMAGAKTLLASSLPTTPAGCTAPKQYVVLITDGLPTLDLSGSDWPPLGSAAATGYGVTATFNADGSLASTNDQALTDTITKITALSNAGIETYVVGLGAGVNPASNPQAAAALAAMAVAGGSSAKTSQITGGTQYFPATSPAVLVQDLQAILTDVSGQSSSSSSAAANSTSLGTNSDVYQATFTPGSSVDNAWTGDLKEYGISTSAAINVNATWSAQTQLDAQGTSRNIATWDPYHLVSSTVTPAAVAFSWSNLSIQLQTQLQQNSTNGQNLINYLIGSHSQEQTSGGLFRIRAHLLGDIVDSSPAYVAAPIEYYPDASYATFTVAQLSRTPMLYFGANDGMLHGVNATTGSELMAFIPNGGNGSINSTTFVGNGVFNNLYMLASPYYFYHHQFYVDGSPQVTDVLLSTDGKWHSMLVGGENGGGSSIYALDVTNPGTFTSSTAVANEVLWEFTDPGMGLSYSTPVVVRSNAVAVTDKDYAVPASVNGFAVLFGNGYNSAGGQPIFYAVNASTGALLAKINLCTASGVSTTACSSTTANGLSSISAANSSGVIGVPQDMAYAGDLQGNLWAINMSSATPANWTVKLLFQARDSSGNAQPITSAPALTPNPNFPKELGLMAFFGTGELLTQADLTNANTQSFYGIFDNTSDLASYATAYKPGAVPYTRSNLKSQTISTLTVSIGGISEPALISTNNPVNLTYVPVLVANTPPATGTTPYNPVEGWYLDLSSIASGTRSYTNAQVESGGVLFTSDTPPATACLQPASYLLNLNYSTGGPFASPSVGAPGGTAIGTATSGGSAVNIVGVFVGAAYSAAPTTIGTGQGTSEQIISTANGLVPVPTPANKASHLGWWQIQ
jgi:type IV pilus assembly protein PilY1